MLLGRARAGRARVRLTAIDGQIAAFAACFVTAGWLWVWSNATDPGLLHYSPGLLATAEVVRFAGLDPRVDVLDGGAGIQRFTTSGAAGLASTQSLAMDSSWVRRVLHRLAA